GPAADGDQGLESGMLRLELLELVERPGKRLVPGVGDTGDGVGRRVAHAEVSPGIACAVGAVRPGALRLVGDEALEALVVDVAERVVDVREVVGAARAVELAQLV